MHKIKFNAYSPEFKVWVCVLFIVLQSACSTHKPAVSYPPVVERPPRELPPDPIPRVEPRSKYGNPSSYVVFGKRYYTLPSSHGFVERGIASWYGKKFHGKRTSSGETYNMYSMTAAHTRLPLPTYVQVKNLKNSRTVTVRVNDRGPFHNNRVIDLSYSAATKLGIIKDGTGLVEIRAIDPMNYRVAQKSKETVARDVKTVVMQDSREHDGSKTEQENLEIINSQPRVFVQVGAFSDRANANLLLNQLRELDLGEIFISSIVFEEKQLHRVRIGPISTVQIADDTVMRLSDMGMREHRVVIE